MPLPTTPTPQKHTHTPTHTHTNTSRCLPNVEPSYSPENQIRRSLRRCSNVAIPPGPIRPQPHSVCWLTSKTTSSNSQPPSIPVWPLPLVRHGLILMEGTGHVVSDCFALWY